jgi:hypothetical protein
MRILVLTNKDEAELIQVRLHFRQPQLAPRVEHRNRSDVSDTSAVADILREDFDAIILPLSLPNFNSVRIAEFVHLLTLPVRLVLKSQTNVPRETLLRLFDEFWESHLNFQSLDHLHELQPRRITDRSELERAIFAVLRQASCFTSKHGEHATEREYRAYEPPKERLLHQITQHYHGQVNMSHDQISVAHVSGPINIKAKLDTVSQTVTVAPVGMEQGGDNLASLMEELKAALKSATAAAAQDDVDRIAQAAELVRSEAEKTTPNRSFLRITAEGLKEAAKAIEAIAPSVMGLAVRIASTVAGVP